MRTHTRSGLLAAALVASGAGCSLLNLDQFSLATCTSSADCEPANVSHGIATTACMRYQCVMSACALSPLDADGDGDPPPSCSGTDCDDSNPRRAGARVMAHETCDGIDNDCNDVIDEGVVRPRSNQPLLTDANGVSSVTYAGVPGGTAIAMSHTTDNRSGWNVMTGPASAPGMLQPLGYFYQADIDTIDPNPPHAVLRSSYEHPGLAPGCEVPVSSTPPAMGGMCSTADVAAAATDESYEIIAAINTSGCSSGQLRIGYAGPNDPGDAVPHPAGIVGRGPPSRSNVVFGVDEDPAASDCTGLTQAAHGGLHGAALPNVAAMTTMAGGPQGLVAFLGGPQPRQVCQGVQVPVEAVGVWLASGTTSGTAIPIHWTVGTGSGVPGVVGMTTGGGRPAIAAWPNAGSPGYFLAFGNTAHQMELHFIAGLPAPPTAPIDTTPDYTPAATPSLASAVEAAFSPSSMGGGPVDYVTLQPGVTSTTDADIGATWIESCGPGSTLLFQRFNYAAGSPGNWSATGTPVVLDASVPAGPAAMAYVPSGLVMPGYVRGGVTATLQTTGGWVVAWIGANGHVLARRLAALDGQPIDEPNIDVSAPVPGSASFPALYPDDAMHPHLLHYAYASGAGLVGGDLLCGDGT